RLSQMLRRSRSQPRCAARKAREQPPGRSLKPQANRQSEADSFQQHSVPAWSASCHRAEGWCSMRCIRAQTQRLPARAAGVQEAAGIMLSTDILVVGAGIAGAGVAAAIDGRRDVVLLEQEARPG